MPDSPTVSADLRETILEAALSELGGEPLDGTGFEGETPTNLDAEPLEGDSQ